MWELILKAAPYAIGLLVALGGAAFALYFKKGKDFYERALQEINDVLTELDDVDDAVELVINEPSEANILRLKDEVIQVWDEIQDVIKLVEDVVPD